MGGTTAQIDIKQAYERAIWADADNTLVLRQFPTFWKCYDTIDRGRPIADCPLCRHNDVCEICELHEEFPLPVDIPVDELAGRRGLDSYEEAICAMAPPEVDWVDKVRQKGVSFSLSLSLSLSCEPQPVFLTFICVRIQPPEKKESFFGRLFSRKKTEEAKAPEPAAADDSCAATVGFTGTGTAGSRPPTATGERPKSALRDRPTSASSRPTSADDKSRPPSALRPISATERRPTSYGVRASSGARRVGFAP
jgi:hypothetical protein